MDCGFSQKMMGTLATYRGDWVRVRLRANYGNEVQRGYDSAGRITPHKPSFIVDINELPGSETHFTFIVLIKLHSTTASPSFSDWAQKN